MGLVGVGQVRMEQTQQLVLLAAVAMEQHQQ